MSGRLSVPATDLPRPRAIEPVPVRLPTAMFTPSAFGGHARYTRELLTALAEVGAPRGVRPALVTSEDLTDEYRTPAYPIHAILPRLAPRSELPSKAAWVASRLTHYPRRERALLRWVAGRPDLAVVHVQEMTPWIAPWLYGAIRRRGVAVVETVHNIQLHKYYNRSHKKVGDALTRAAWRRCDALLVHTDGLKGELAAFLGPGHPPIFVTPHGVWSVSEAHGSTAAPAPADPDAPLLFFGVVRENKGLHVLIEAMAKLPGRRLVAAGHFPSGSYLGEIRDLIDRHAPGRVELHDRFVTEAEAAAFFDGSGLVVLPYTAFASQSGVLHQALAHGRPVAVTDVGALGESVRSWGTGVVVPAEDPDALAAGIAEALEPRRFQRAVDATLRVRESLSWSRAAELTIDAYEAAVVRVRGTPDANRA